MTVLAPLSVAGAGRPRILFVHVSPDGQFGFFGRWLAGQGWDVTMAHRGDAPDRLADGIRHVTFRHVPTVHGAQDFRHALDYAAANALAAAELFLRLRDADGYCPDVVMAHVGWGVGLCVKQVWHGTRYVAYHEWYYTDRDWSRDGRAERPATLTGIAVNRMRNLAITAEFDSADANWCPTPFQASRFPPPLRRLLTVVPDGVDCATCCPDPEARIDFDWLALAAGTPVLTYATRGQEPVRGFPQFLRAVALLQKRRADFHTVILGRDAVCYGTPLAHGKSWRLRMLDDLDLDHRRLHFHDPKPRADYLRLLQASTAHVYFTERFVTSWSLFESLACGCLVIGSNTAPVEHLVTDGETGLLVDMDDAEEVAEMIAWSIDNPKAAAALRAAARRKMLAEYDSAHVFPEKTAALRRLVAEAAFPVGTGGSLLPGSDAGGCRTSC